jgi:DNA-binding MarR family transcriptional regulator
MVEYKGFTNEEFLDTSLGSLVSTVSRGYLIFLFHEIEQYGIHGGQFQFLRSLSKKDSISQEELANIYHNHQSTIARALRKLEDEGMVERNVDENNRRKNIITITEKGRKIVDDIRLMDEKWEDNIKSLTVDEKNKLKELLKTLASELLENMKKEWIGMERKKHEDLPDFK